MADSNIDNHPDEASLHRDSWPRRLADGSAPCARRLRLWATLMNFLGAKDSMMSAEAARHILICADIKISRATAEPRHRRHVDYEHFSWHHQRSRGDDALCADGRRHRIGAAMKLIAEVFIACGGRSLH